MKILITLILASCFARVGFSQEVSLKREGKWRPVYEEIAGNPLPEAAYSTQTMVLSDSNYVVTAESVDKGVVRYDGDRMDIYGREGVNAGKHFKAIFRMERKQEEGSWRMGEDEKLTICYNLKGDNYPGQFSTKGQPMYFMAVFVKEK